MSSRVLIVDDEPFNLDILKEELGDKGYVVETATDGGNALRKVEASQPDLILLDYMMPDLNGLEVLKELRRKGNEVPVVMITAHGTIERAVQAMKEGAYDFITRPFEPDHIGLVVQKALEREKLRREVEILTQEVGQRYHLVVGESPKMNQAVDLAKRAAASKATVLFLGESGTGKEIFARAIHNWSERKGEPFVTVNCVGLSKDLLESELFGHEQGAFTGAHQLKRGKMELAQGGTVFLDEVGDISEELQTKLLRFLQEREFERVGGTRLISVDVRIVAATNRDLDTSVQEGRFREDLYHRLNVVSITLPPLRERREDIPNLCQYFLRRFSRETRKNVSEITEEAMERLLSYGWPGNVRELANVIERAVVLGLSSKITLEDLPTRILARELRVTPDSSLYREGMSAARRELILRALSQARGNRALAAKALGLDAKYFLRLIKSLQID